MLKTEETITFKGNPLSLTGNKVKVGEPAPDFTVLQNDLSPVKLSDFKDNVCVICSVPSLDTSVCDTEIRKFNEHASKMDDDVRVLAISMDLPFAQGRWCGAASIENVQTLSDHLKADFGNAFGVLIEQLRLLARAIFIIDKAGIISYIQIVDEMTNEPDYEEALKAVEEATK